ncbi:MAG: glycosyltransferase family 4 protein [Gemmatimonadales bacterium]
MRVLLLNYEYPPLGGGAAVATEALARGLGSRGHRVDVVTTGEPAGVESTLVWDGRGREEGVLTVHRVASRRTAIHQAGMGDAFSYLTTALPVVRRLLRTEKYDVAHFFFSLPTGALLPLLDLRDTPVIVSLRGSDVPGYDTHHPQVQRAHRMLRPLTRWIWRRADRVVAVCESLGALALSTLPTLRYVVIPNGVDLAHFRPRARSRLPRQERIRCLAVARLVQRKGLGDLIVALASLERGRFELEIVGSGPDEAALRGLAASLGLGSYVTFSGSLDRAEVARRYRAADLFTLASREEAFGNVFAEALASGLPIVASAAGGIPELVHHGQNGLLVPPGDPGALAAAIKLLANDPQLRLKMALRNRAQAEANLSWERVTTRYLSIYNGALRRAPAKRLPAELPANTW